MKSALVVVNDISALESYNKWEDIERVIFVNVGQPDYFELKSRIKNIVWDKLSIDIVTFVSFPVPSSSNIPYCLLRGIGLLFSSNAEVLGDEYKHPEGCLAGSCAK